MFRIKRRRICLFIGFLSVLGLAVFQPPCFAAEADDEKVPDRLVKMAIEYPGVVIPLDDDVSMDIIFHNKGRSDEDVDIWIEDIPKGWESRAKTYQFTVTSVHVPSEDDKTIQFEAKPDKTVKPGKYEFHVKAKTRDGRFRMAQTVVVTVKKGEKKEEKGITLTTSYPVLQGPSDAKFEFSIEVDSGLEKDAVFDLFAKGPEGWDIKFKPAYESKFISSLRIKKKQSSTVAVEVQPYVLAKAGEYPVNIRVSSGDAKAEAKLTVILTGTYGLEVGTSTGLLSLNARQGKPANMSFYVKNTGSAANKDIKFMTFKPENWTVEFKPEKIDIIGPEELKQVEVTVTPNEDALVGDYSVNVKVEGEKASKAIEFRVTVKASSAWGWIGIAIIVLVIIGLTLLFRRLGRR